MRRAARRADAEAKRHRKKTTDRVKTSTSAFNKFLRDDSSGPDGLDGLDDDVCSEVQVLVGHRRGKGQQGVGAGKDSAAVQRPPKVAVVYVFADAHQRTATVDLNARRADAVAYPVALVIELVDGALVVGL